MICKDLELEKIFDTLKFNTEDLQICSLFGGKSQNIIVLGDTTSSDTYLEKLEFFIKDLLKKNNSFSFFSSFFLFPTNPLDEYITSSKKKVKLILERRFYKNLYNWIKKISEEIEGEILKILFQGIENKYSPEKCLISL